MNGSERGSASVEMVLITPVLVVLLLFVVAVGRLASAQGEVESAARDAARAAASGRSSTAAQALGNAAATATLADRGVECTSLTVEIDTSAFRADGIVGATVHCVVDLEAVAGLGLPASRTLTSSFTAPVDRYRGADQ
ncbi:MAG: TadE/TadG family type IV pilus assembly protein [Acidimicrobiia bacterium]